ncbi:hypothetical protein GCM10008938_17310 [Deinococcus roseus]|uniref:Uncharacterized protein n=1 Tax=Deinococcus roseus TaxID=392414 RepID=A0ABQ2D1Z7_9DEIO|nr:hypothetical protein GCM10008938_17310 [Deinococcus roseus]
MRSGKSQNNKRRGNLVGFSPQGGSGWQDSLLQNIEFQGKRGSGKHQDNMQKARIEDTRSI